MPEYILLLFSAAWLGILTSISPCPLATNIAAVSYVSKEMNQPFRVLLAGITYTAGRVLTYTIIGTILVSSILSAPLLSNTLQKYMNLLLGPVLLLTGMVLLEIISINLRDSKLKERMQNKAKSMGLLGSGLLGIIFALSFCPTSAALFFGSLIPIAVKHNSGLLIPAVYGTGTGLPVIIFAFLFAAGMKKIGGIFNKITKFEKHARKITGLIFILTGIYYSLVNIFEVNI